MSNPQNPDFLQILPRIPLAEEVDVDLLLAYRDQLTQLGSSAPHLRAEMAWNDLEIGIATKSSTSVDAAFDTFHELHDTPDIHLGYSELVDTRLVIASKPSFRRRLSSQSSNKRSINRIYSQVGSVIADCLEFEADGASSGTRKLPELVAYGALLRAKDENNAPCPASPRERVGRGADSHNFYTLRYNPAPQKTAILRVREQGDEQEPPQKLETNVAYMLPLAAQAIRSCNEDWARAMAGRGTPTAQGRRWLRYVGEQLVRESGGRAVKPRAGQVLDFVTFHLYGLLDIDLPSRQRRPAGLENTSLAEQLRRKFPTD